MECSELHFLQTGDYAYWSECSTWDIGLGPPYTLATNPFTDFEIQNTLIIPYITEKNKMFMLAVILKIMHFRCPLLRNFVLVWC